MKGIILAGGSGSRLYPSTISTSKQLVPVYDKPMIFYPLSVLMLAGIRDILIITNEKDSSRYQMLLGDGGHYGINIKYKIQPKPEGIAQAFIIGENFIGKENVVLILGDNIFYGNGFSSMLKRAYLRKEGATIFGYYVKDPQRFGVVEYDENKKAISIEEKPTRPKSNFAVTGLYFYDNDVLKVAKNLKPSKRGELEITDINNYYIKNSFLNVENLGRGFNWFDTGTHDSLLDASNFVKNVEDRQGIKIACLEEISFSKNWINKKQLKQEYEKLKNTQYGKYLKKLI